MTPYGMKNVVSLPMYQSDEERIFLAQMAWIRDDNAENCEELSEYLRFCLKLCALWRTSEETKK